MEGAIEHRGASRHPAKLEAVIEYFPARVADGGRWWENFTARTVDVSESGAQFTALDRIKPGGRVRLIVSSEEDGERAIDIAGDIVWVREPVLPWLGKYRVGIMFRPALQDDVSSLLHRADSHSHPRTII